MDRSWWGGGGVGVGLETIQDLLPITKSRQNKHVSLTSVDFHFANGENTSVWQNDSTPRSRLYHTGYDDSSVIRAAHLVPLFHYDRPQNVLFLKQDFPLLLGPKIRIDSTPWEMLISRDPLGTDWFVEFSTLLRYCIHLNVLRSSRPK